MSDHDFTPLVARLREAACQAVKGGTIAQSAPHPDAEFLELCVSCVRRCSAVRPIFLA